MIVSKGYQSRQLKVRYSPKKTLFLARPPRNQLGSFTLPGVSVITCTNRPHQIEQLLGNYLRQVYANKELLIVLNDDYFDLNDLKLRTARYPDIRIFQLGAEKSLGECLNYALTQSSFDYFAKFDDDDYYAPQYLQSSILDSLHTKADVIGKCSIYVYFKGSSTLFLLSPGNEDTYINSVRGATLIIKKQVLSRLNFPPVNLGEDTGFIEECIREGIAIYSTSRFEYVSIRGNARDHTWQLDEAGFLNSFHSHQAVAHNLPLANVYQYISR